MDKVRSICWDWTQEDIEFLAQFGIKIPKPGLERFEIPEDERYFKIRERFEKQWGNSRLNDCRGFIYSREDLISSEYCILKGMNTCGYPQPEMEYIGNYYQYDLSSYCPRCGTGLVQVDDFRINKVPKANLWKFCSWINDVLFAKEDFYKEVFEPLGFGCRPVRMVSGKIREGVVQIEIPVIDEELNLEGHPYYLCPECGRKQYTCAILYPFFPLHKNPLPHLYLSKEYFGSGPSADRKIFISTELALQLIKRKEFNRHYLIPCKKDLKIEV